jgi:hypothetical protein
MNLLCGCQKQAKMDRRESMTSNPTNGTKDKDATPSRVDDAPLFASLSVPRGLPTGQP